MSAAERSYAESTVVAATPQQVYDLVSDVTRTGEWSPICRACWWDEGDEPRVGAWFTGRNEVPGRTWETRSLVVAADPGERFAFVVGGSLVRWSYTLAPVDGGTELTESWQFLPAGLAMFAEKYGEDAPAQIEDRTRAAHAGIPASLAAIRAIVESGQLAT